MQRNLVKFAGYSGAIAVALGALGAHYLKQKVTEGVLTDDNVQSFDTAVKYQVYHTLALLCIAILYDKLNRKYADFSRVCFTVGIVLFSGSIYILSTRALFGIEGLRWLGPVTPIGGVLFIVGWLALAFSAYSRRKKTDANG